MQINKKIDDLLTEFTTTGGAGRMKARDFAKAALKAALKGIGEFDAADKVVTKVNTQWEDFMKLITTDATELARLCGKDTAFMDKKWSKHCLAYMVGDSTCTSTTNITTGPRRTMDMDIVLTRRMREMLDAEGTDLDFFE